MISAAFLYGGAWLHVSGSRETLAETIREGGWTYAVISAESAPIDDAVLLATGRGQAEDWEADLLGGSIEQTGFA